MLWAERPLATSRSWLLAFVRRGQILVARPRFPPPKTGGESPLTRLLFAGLAPDICHTGDFLSASTAKWLTPSSLRHSKALILVWTGFPLPDRATCETGGYFLSRPLGPRFRAADFSFCPRLQFLFQSALRRLWPSLIICFRRLFLYCRARAFFFP